MTREFFSWKINSQNQSTNDNVLIALMDANKNTIEEIELKQIHSEDIYKLLDKDNPIHFKNVYIESFNLKDYRSSRKIPEEKRLKIKGIDIQSSFINHSESINLENIEVEDSFNFSHSVFLQKGNFKSLIITSKTCLFENSLIFSGEFDFSETIIKSKDFSFKNSIFRKGTKNFQNIKFEAENVLFINTNFGDGDVLFNGAKFEKSRKSFKVATFGKGRIDFNNVNFNEGEVIFEKTNFGEGSVNFRSTHFSGGKIEFMSAQFGLGTINFIHTNFGDGAVSFKNTNFGSGKVSFKLAEFGKGKIDFHFAEFDQGDLIFDRTNFGSDSVDFRAVNFGTGKVNFNRCRFFHGDISFEASELKNSNFYINHCLFEQANINMETLSFWSSTIQIIDSELQSAKVSFKHSSIKQLILSSIQLDNYVDLRMEKCNFLDLSDTVVKGILDITPDDYNTKIGTISLSGMRLLGRIYIDWEKSGVKQFILEQKVSYHNKAEQFRILKENYNSIGQYEAEDAAYVEFKRAESKAILFDSKKNKNRSKVLIAYIRYSFQYLIFDKVGKYATDPVRVLLSMGGTYLFFTFLYVVMPYFTDTNIISSLFEPDDPRNLGEISRAFYHSAITFLTIGYGDYYPSGLSRWVSSIEGFIGLFLMSYFTVAFVRKILR